MHMNVVLNCYEKVTPIARYGGLASGSYTTRFFMVSDLGMPAELRGVTMASPFHSFPRRSRYDDLTT